MEPWRGQGAADISVDISEDISEDISVDISGTMVRSEKMALWIYLTYI
jgi:hypothetical protein